VEFVCGEAVWGKCVVLWWFLCSHEDGDVHHVDVSAGLWSITSLYFIRFGSRLPPKLLGLVLGGVIARLVMGVELCLGLLSFFGWLVRRGGSVFSLAPVIGLAGGEPIVDSQSQVNFDVWMV